MKYDSCLCASVSNFNRDLSITMLPNYYGLSNATASDARRGFGRNLENGYSRDVAKQGPISGVVRGRESVISVCQHYSDVSHESSRICQCIKDSLLKQ